MIKSDLKVKLSREERRELFESSVDWKLMIYPFVFHTAVVNWNGSGKDLLINADLYNLYFYSKSILHDVIKYVYNRPEYYRKIQNIYSNAVLNKDVYEDDYYKVSSYQDIKDSENGVLYLHDAERYFNSLGMNVRGEDGKLIDFINNKRKDFIMLRLSFHRFSSIHVRVRELIPSWLLPDLYLLPNTDRMYMKNYVVHYKVCDLNGFQVYQDVLKDLPRYAFLYDTLEKAVVLKKDL